MSRAARYTPVGESVEQGPARVSRGLDSVTGLPVRIYRFSAEPVRGATELDHPHVFRALEAGLDDGEGFVVADLVDGAAPVTNRPTLLDDAAAVAACAALAEAAERGMTHGDLGPHRVYRRGLDVWLEGYGVPWSDRGLTDDARALAAGLHGLDGNALSPAVSAALSEAAESDDIDAASLASAVAEAATGAAGLQAQSEPAEPATLDFDEVVLELEGENRPPEGGLEPRRSAHGDTAKAPARPPEAPARTEREPELPAEPERPYERLRAQPPASPESSPIARPKEPAARPAPQRVPPQPPTERGGFSKRPPPDVDYRLGDTPVHQPRAAGSRGQAVPGDVRTQRRRTWLLAALLLLAVVLAVVTAIGRQPVPPPPEPSGPLSSFVVEVALEPASLPPASLVVLESPPGSRHPPGSVLGTVPRRVVFDAEGVWRVQGRFQEQQSDPVTFQLPQDRAVVLRFPSSP